MNIKKILFFFIFILVLIGLLSISVRGIKGNPSESSLNDSKWNENGPFELSPERGRFALTFSIVENKSFYFSLPIAQFATPDLGYKNGNYVSLFAPAVSFIIMPGYMVGKWFGVAQVGSFLIIALFAILNVILIRSIAILLKAIPIAATLASMVFLFATPAYTYSVTLYQHHISTFLILICIYALLKWNTLWSLFLIWFAVAISISVDYPNFFLMLPIGIYALGKIVYLVHEKGSIVFNINLVRILSLIGIAFPLLFFLWFNQKSYGNPLQLSGTVEAVKVIDKNIKLGSVRDPQLIVDNTTKNIDDAQEKSAVGFFKTRNLLNGFFIHFFSKDRGIVFYTPIMLFGIIGSYYLYKENRKIIGLFVLIIGINILLYSMWGDPYGGWAFGSRYLIPSYSLMAILISIFLTKLRKKTLLLIFFYVVMLYSIGVNTLGAITTSRIPPSAEVAALEKISGRVEKYSFDRDIDFLQFQGAKSFFWQEFAKRYMSATTFYLLLYLSIFAFATLLVVAIII